MHFERARTLSNALGVHFILSVSVHIFNLLETVSIPNSGVSARCGPIFLHSNSRWSLESDALQEPLSATTDTAAGTRPGGSKPSAYTNKIELFLHMCVFHIFDHTHTHVLDPRSAVTPSGTSVLHVFSNLMGELPEIF